MRAYVRAREKERYANFALLKLFIPFVLRRVCLLWRLFSPATFSPISVLAQFFIRNHRGRRKCGVSMEFDKVHSKHNVHCHYVSLIFKYSLLIVFLMCALGRHKRPSINPWADVRDVERHEREAGEIDCASAPIVHNNIEKYLLLKSASCFTRKL